MRPTRNPGHRSRGLFHRFYLLLLYTDKAPKRLNVRNLGVFLLVEFYLLIEANRFVRVYEKNRLNSVCKEGVPRRTPS